MVSQQTKGEKNSMTQPQFIRKTSSLLVLVFLVSLMLPVVSFAATQAFFYFDPSTGKLSGSVYVADHESVSVVVYDDAGNTVNIDTYKDVYLGVNAAVYDDNNTAYYGASYRGIPLAQAPSKIVIDENGSVLEAVYNPDYNGYGDRSYYQSTSGHVRLAAYRMTGENLFTSYEAGSYLAAGSTLFKFTPTQNESDGIQLLLPMSPTLSFTTVNRANVQLSDFVVRDLTVNEEVYLSSVETVDLLPLVTLRTENKLVSGHLYEIQLTSTSGGDEIQMPPAGNSYFATVTAGEFVTYTYSNGTSSTYFIDRNIIFFDNFQITSSSSAPVTGGSGGGVAAPPVEYITEVENGVKLGNGAATVTHETVDGKKVTKVVLNRDKLGEAFGLLKGKAQGAQTVTLKVDGTDAVTNVGLPADVLAEAQRSTPDAMITIQTDAASYDLPIKVLDIEALAGELSAEAKDVSVQLVIEKVSGSVAEQIAAKAKDAGAILSSEAFDFGLKAVAGDKQVEVNSFSGTYVTRTIIVSQAVGAGTLTGAMYDPVSVEFTFVPAIFRMVDGQTHVTLKRQGNSIYTVLQLDKSFDDIDGHWAKSDIELLASKLVVKGVKETTFAPDAGITRAQFATLIVRSLGLSENKTAAAFSDVSSGGWYTGAVGAAAQAGIVEGFENGTFGPNEKITREQMAVMIARALKVAGKGADVDVADQAKLLAKFTDEASINAWAQESVAQAVEAGILNGIKSDLFAPDEHATRAQATVMLKRLLQYVEFID
jgi:hypothetical protein